MSNAIAFIETYFPPPESVRSPDAGAWFPMHLLMERIGSCKASGCSQQTAYILASAPADTVTPVYAVCDDHVCEFADAVNGHSACPKCHCQWVQPTP